MSEFQAVILAAGRGTRLKSDKPKVLHEVLGRPMVDYSVRAALEAGATRAVVVVGYGRERVEDWLTDQSYADRVEFAVQENQEGTAHAVLSAESHLRDGPAYTAILSGDAPLMDGETFQKFADQTLDSRRPVGIMTAFPEEPGEYGRVVRDDDGAVLEIVEYADADPEQRAIDEVNAGFYIARSELLLDVLPTICEGSPETAQEEYYLTDLVAFASDTDGVYGWEVPDPEHTVGVNTRRELARATEFAKQRINAHWMDQGVTMVDPDRTYVEPGVELAEDVLLHPGVHLRGDTEIGRGTVVEDGCVIRDSEIDEDVLVKAHCYIEEASVESGTQLGPSAHLRPGADIGPNCKVGNYVEVKKARLDEGVKAGHLSYLGDAHLGPGTNVGAGTITCNYDGDEKHHTEIGREVFIGSNTALVAPVEVGDRAYIGAGSTITDDIPSDALGIARGRQRNIEDWVDDD